MLPPWICAVLLPVLTWAGAPSPSWAPFGNASRPGASSPDANGKYELSSEGIRAYFVPYGASLTNLFITDVHGVERDIVLGFDNASHYFEDTLHPHLNGVPGRYANRIKDGTFEIDGTTYHTDLNDNGGRSTLHGGSDGWDYRNWTVLAHTNDSITFGLHDPDGKEGFPGEVRTEVTYTLTPNQWHVSMTSRSMTKKTPIMLTSHVYFNLDGFQNPNTDLVLNHSLYLPHGGLRPAVDTILLPTGDILANKKDGVNDFWSAPKQLGQDFGSPDMLGNCGLNCAGYDGCYINTRDADAQHNWGRAPVATLASSFTGIQLDIYSNQAAVQVYTCNGMNGSLPLKETQGFFNDSSRARVTQKHGCVALEVQDWIDGINHPEWGRESEQIFGPQDDPYVLAATFDFSLNHLLAGE